MYPLSNQEALNTEVNPEVVSQKKIHTGTPQANQHRTSNCQVQGAAERSSTLPSIDVPHWAGGDPRRGGTLLVVGPHQPPREPLRLRPREQAPPAATVVAEVGHARALVERRHRHVHQLFRQLR